MMVSGGLTRLLFALAAATLADGFLVLSFSRGALNHAPTTCRFLRAASKCKARRIMSSGCHDVMCIGGGDGGGDRERQKLSHWQRFVASVQENGPKYLMGDVSRAKLQELGLAVLLSYGWVSNCNMALVLILSWVTFGKTTGHSPLAAGQWPAYLAVYMGFWVACNFLRPLRLAAAAAISPLFDRLLAFFMRIFNIQKPQAVLVTLFLVNIVGTLTLVSGGLYVATSLTGTALLPAGVSFRQYLFKA